MNFTPHPTLSGYAGSAAVPAPPEGVGRPIPATPRDPLTRRSKTQRAHRLLRLLLRAEIRVKAGTRDPQVNARSYLSRCTRRTDLYYAVLTEMVR